MQDPFSDVLELVGVRSSVYFQKDFLSPWCMSVSNTGFAQFHIIVRGKAVVTHVGETHEVLAGDVVFFPKGASHLIGDAPESTPMSGQDVIASMAQGNEPFVEGGAATRMICGHFEYDFECTHSLVEDLPPIILLRSADLPAMDHLFGLVQLIVRESASDAPGKDVVVRRLSDGLLVTILRAYLETRKQDAGFYRGLADRRLARAVAAIHSNTGDNLTVVCHALHFCIISNRRLENRRALTPRIGNCLSLGRLCVTPPTRLKRSHIARATTRHRRFHGPSMGVLASHQPSFAAKVRLIDLNLAGLRRAPAANAASGRSAIAAECAGQINTS